MSIYIPGQNAANITAPNNQAASTERKPTEFWLNIGIPTTVDGEEFLVTLPLNVALDTMPDSTRSGKKLNAAKNALRDQLLAKAQELNAGETLTLPEGALTLQLLRVGNSEVDAEENPFSVTLSF